MAAVMIGLCVVAAAFITGMGFLRWYRNPEHLRWIRIEKRARVRAAAERAARRYASLPSVTVAPPLVPLPPVAPAESRDGQAA